MFSFLGSTELAAEFVEQFNSTEAIRKAELDVEMFGSQSNSIDAAYVPLLELKQAALGQTLHKICLQAISFLWHFKMQLGLGLTP